LGSAWLAAMKIPEFNRTDDFLGYVDIPCLFAKVKNSALPGVAFRHIAECEEDPDCDIYLRGRKPEKFSPWQQGILEQLFEKDGLAAAVTEAMKEYETSPKWAGEGYVHLAEEDRQKIKEHGIAPYITISAVVIDEVRRKVILRADTVIDGNLDEHGISIFLSKERWRFETARYINQYQSLLGEDSEAWRKEFAKKQWELLYPASEPATSGVSAPESLIGNWAFDRSETTKLLKSLKVDSIRSEMLIKNFEDQAISISREVFNFFDLAWAIGDCLDRRGYRVVGSVARGKRLTVTLQGIKHAELGYVETDHLIKKEYWCDGTLLIEDLGVVYRPTDKRPAEGQPWVELFPQLEANAWTESDTSFLHGYWEFDAPKTAQVLEKMGNTKNAIESQLEMQEFLSPTGYRFSPGAKILMTSGEVNTEHDLLGCERSGNRLLLHHRMKSGALVQTDEWWCDGEILVDRNGLAYCRKRDKWAELFPLPEPAGVSDASPTFLLGDWQLDAQKTSEVLKQLGKQPAEIASQIKDDKERLANFRFWFEAENLFTSAPTMTLANQNRPWECERNGNRVMIRQRTKSGEIFLSVEFWCDGEFLVKRSGTAYQRVTSSRLKVTG
jgi:hypothetical protein